MLEKYKKIQLIMEEIIGLCEKIIVSPISNFDIVSQNNYLASKLDELELFYKEESFPLDYGSANAEMQSVRASANRVSEMANISKEEAIKKIEFELLPLVENMRMNFYYFNFAIRDEESKRRFFDSEHRKYCKNRYLEKAKIEGKYKYDLSILVIAYNKLEYTKKCVESLKRYLPKGISYELIFVNHGSNDGTKEFFEEELPHKQLDIEVNGGGIWAANAIVEGKYRLAISNDVLITENAVENLYLCISSAEDIGWVVPTTPNVSNLQTIPAKYNTIEEMYTFASQNNVSDKRRWEEKPRLCNPVDIIKTEIWFELIGKVMPTLWGISFPDDKTSMLLRRAGYKMLLAKDAYCHHFGSITIGNEMENQLNARINYCRGRINFIKEYGMDPWGYGFAYDIGLINNMCIVEKDTTRILGINSGIGGNLLKLKSLLREKESCKAVYIDTITQYEMNKDDLRGISDKSIEIENWTSFSNVIKERYDYVLLENGFQLADLHIIEELKKILLADGKIFLRVKSDAVKDCVLAVYKKADAIVGTEGYWLQIA